MVIKPRAKVQKYQASIHSTLVGALAQRVISAQPLSKASQSVRVLPAGAR